MKIPNGKHALVDLAKLMEYSLNPEHQSGGHKREYFAQPWH
jgi:hypothetical protein